jgi:hypothetical protein
VLLLCPNYMGCAVLKATSEYRQYSTLEPAEHRRPLIHRPGNTKNRDTYVCTLSNAMPRPGNEHLGQPIIPLTTNPWVLLGLDPSLHRCTAGDLRIGTVAAFSESGAIAAL